jgi:hypothetical protein
MPIRVPKYGERQQSLRGLDTSGGSMRIQPQDITGGAGQALQDLSGQATDLYAKALKETNETRVMEAANRLDEFQNEKITGEALTQQGKDALNLTDEYLPAFEEKTEEIKQDLNEPQRQAFEELASKRRSGVQKSLMKHQQREFQKYQEQEFEAYRENRFRDALENHDDPVAINQNLLGARQSIRVQAENEGWGEERTKEALEAAGSNIVYGAIERQTANGQAELAA